MRKMTIEDKKRVIELEKRERWAIKEIITILNAKGNYKYDIYLSTIDSDCPWDCILTVKDLNNNILETFMVEMKNRSNDWSDTGFVFEKKKYNDLLKARTNVQFELQRPITIMYWNTTPTKFTYIWNIDSLTLGKSKRKAMKKETFAENNQEVNKNVFLLDVNDATKFNWKYDENKYLDSLPKPIEFKTNNIEKEKYIASIF